jgi:hypothetical protein
MLTAGFLMEAVYVLGVWFVVTAVIVIFARTLYPPDDFNNV